MNILASTPTPHTETLTDNTSALTRQELLSSVVQRKRTTTRSPLENALGADRLAWLAQYARRRRDACYAALSGWRTKLERYELQSEDNFTWRKRQGNRNAGHKSIFDVQNDSLNVVGSFAEFFTAQARNDLFGSAPWFAARPEGRADQKLADHLTKHAAWTLRQSNVVDTYHEAVKLTAILGTCFTKKTWTIVTDEYEEPVTALQSLDTHAPVLTTTGEPIFAGDEITEEPDETQTITRRYPQKDPRTDLSTGHYEYGTAFRTRSRVLYRNVKACNLHYKDIAFDPTAPELELTHTDFYHNFTKNLGDLRRDYDLNAEDVQRLHTCLTTQPEARRALDHRGESSAELSWHENGPDSDGLPNIPVNLTEGYLRLDVMGDGRMAQVYIVFCAELDLVLKVDYLANITPGGALPVHAHTLERYPHRIVGRGFYEHLESAQTIVDDCFNRINWHDRKRSQPIQAFDKSQLQQEDEDADEPFDDEKPVNLKPGARLEDYVQFLGYPELSDRTLSMLNMTVQMVQLRKGITAATQGDLTGVPENHTATGIRQLMSRAAVLLKCPIDDLKRSFTRDLTYTVQLIYENFDREEAFVYGEGENMELIQLRPEDVQDLIINIEILLTQAQNAYKLENARAGIELFMGYVQLPEPEKQSGRSLWIQALRALDFADADQIIRPAQEEPEPPAEPEPEPGLMEQTPPPDASAPPQDEAAAAIPTEPPAMPLPTPMPAPEQTQPTPAPPAEQAV